MAFNFNKLMQEAKQNRLETENKTKTTKVNGGHKSYPNGIAKNQFNGESSSNLAKKTSSPKDGPSSDAVRAFLVKQKLREQEELKRKDEEKRRLLAARVKEPKRKSNIEEELSTIVKIKQKAKTKPSEIWNEEEKRSRERKKAEESALEIAKQKFKQISAQTNKADSKNASLKTLTYVFNDKSKQNGKKDEIKKSSLSNFKIPSVKISPDKPVDFTKLMTVASKNRDSDPDCRSAKKKVKRKLSQSEHRADKRPRLENVDNCNKKKKCNEISTIKNNIKTLPKKMDDGTQAPSRTSFDKFSCNKSLVIKKQRLMVNSSASSKSDIVPAQKAGTSKTIDFEAKKPIPTKLKVDQIQRQSFQKPIANPPSKNVLLQRPVAQSKSNLPRRPGTPPKTNLPRRSGTPPRTLTRAPVISKASLPRLSGTPPRTILPRRPGTPPKTILPRRPGTPPRSDGVAKRSLPSSGPSYISQAKRIEIERAALHRREMMFKHPERFLPVKRDLEELEDEEDSDMDSFIDDTEYDDGGNVVEYRDEIHKLFKYNPNRFKFNDDDDDPSMETSFKDIQKEEARSARLGLMEDLEDIQREQDELKRKQTVKPGAKKR